MASGFLAEYWGWPAIFYVNGTLGAVWTVLYVFLGADSPQTSRMISAEERLYIQTSLGHVGGQKVNSYTEMHLISQKVITKSILFPETENSMDENLDVVIFYIPDRGALRTELGLLDPDDGDPLLHESSARSRYQGGNYFLS